MALDLFINIPIGLLGIALVSIYIENFKEEKREPFDLVGFILAGVGLVGLAFGFSVLGPLLQSPTRSSPGC